MSEIAMMTTSLFKSRVKRITDASRRKVVISEEREITKTLEELKRELNNLYIQFDFMSDPLLMDSCIYTIKAVNSKYAFYLNRCKEIKSS
jgi:hypothetical protein